MKIEEAKEKYPTYFKKKSIVNKFNARRVDLDGMSFHSASEGSYYLELKLQQRAGLFKSFDCQVKEEFYAYGKHICNYYVDFLVHHHDGVKEYIEHKSSGTVTEVWRRNWKLLLAKYDKEISRGEIRCTINWYKAPYKYRPKGSKVIHS